MKIVVVGGGFAGVKTALELANKPGFKITLISQGPNFEYHGALYRAGTGHSPLEVVIPLSDIFKHTHNVELVLDKVVGLDPLKQRVVSEMGEVYGYDKLVLAMGNVVNYFGLKGMDEHSQSMDTIASTIRLRHELARLFRAHHKQASVAVVGAGASGVELAGELQNFAKLIAEREDKPVVKVEVTLVEGAPRVLPMLHEKASAKAEARLRHLGVKLKLNTKVNSCEPGKLCLEGDDLSADLIVWTAGSKAVSFYAEHPDIFELERGRVKVDQYMLAQGQTDIYVLGDNAATPFSGMAQTALHDAKFVARNLLSEKAGKQPVTYRAWHPIYVVPIGPNWAVLQTQKGVISGYRGWLVRRRADLSIFRNFEPYKQALKTWRKGNRLANF